MVSMIMFNIFEIASVTVGALFIACGSGIIDIPSINNIKRAILIIGGLMFIFNVYLLYHYFNTIGVVWS